MIDLYTWITPNGRKASILLEELGLPYRVHAIDITKGEQFAPDFLVHAPNNRIPAIHDPETGVSLMESGAIMIYLAEKTGQFYPSDLKTRAAVNQWLMWQMGGFGPMLGQVHFFRHYNKGLSDVAEARYVKEALRLYGVLDRQLARTPYVAGDSYTIADMAIWPWAARFEWQGINPEDFPNIRRWYTEIAARPAVQRGYDQPKPTGPIPRW